MNEPTTPSHHAPAARPDAATYMALFNDEQTRCAPGALMANNSRLAYLVHLHALIKAFEVRADVSEPITLATRRPDLLALKLDARNTRKVLPKVRIVLGLLESRAEEALPARQSLHLAVANGAYQANVPFHRAWESIKATLATKQLHLGDLLSAAHSGHPVFAFDNLTLAAQRAAITLCSGFSPQLRTLLLDGDSTPALADAGTTRTLTKALDVTRRELRQLLAVNAVGASGTSVTRSVNVTSAVAPSSAVHGAVFINNAGAPLYLTESTTAQTPAKKTVHITGLTQAHIDRLTRMLRLQRAMGLSAAETDGLVMATLRAQGQAADYQLTDNTLRALGLFRHLQRKYKVTPWQYAAFLDEICLYATGTDVAFYDRLFAAGSNDEHAPALPVLNLDDTDFDPSAASGADALTLKQLALALKVDDAALRIILGWVVDAQSLGKPKRSLAVISACYRIVALSRLFGTSTGDGLILLELLMQEQPAYRKQLAGKPTLLGETGKADIVDVLAGVAQTADWLQQQGLNAKSLAALVGRQMPYAPQAWENAFKAELSDTQNFAALHHALSRALGLETEQLAAPVMRWANVDPAALNDRIAAIRQACSSGGSPLSYFSALDHQQWWALQQHADAVKQFKLSADALWQISLNPGWFDLKGKGKKTARPLDLTTVHQLASYQAILRQLPPGQREGDVLKYLAGFDTDTNGPVEGTRVGDAWSTLERLLGRPSGSLATSTSLPPPTSLRGIDRLMRLLTLAEKHEVAADTLLDLGKLPQAQAKDYALFQQVAVGLRQGCSPQQRKAHDEQLSVDWRNALMRWMIVQWVPKDPSRKWINSPQALADYLLLDLQVSHEPLTTRILSATASLQRYLHQIHSHLENGYRSTAISEAQREDWEKFSSSYERWKLRKDAHNEPQNFIDPTRRERKTIAFKGLETQLAQGKCTADEIHIAMLEYLSTFEKLSNIQPISVYADGTSPLTDTYHFIGKTNVEPMEYFWRTLDLSVRDSNGVPSMLAWGEWEKITLTVNGKIATTPLPKTDSQPVVIGNDTPTGEKAKAVAATPESERSEAGTHDVIDLVRPVVIAGRRYVVWVERDATAIVLGKDNKQSPFYPIRVCFSYQQTDGSWTPGNELMCLDGHNAAGIFDPNLDQHEIVNGSSSPNPYLKTKAFQPGLMAMVNKEGDRHDDPWLTVLLFDAHTSAKPTENYYIATKDLLLLENKSLDVNNTEKPIELNLVTEWLRLYKNPRTVQHPYTGASKVLNAQVDTKTQFTWSTAQSGSKLAEVYNLPPIGGIGVTAQLSDDERRIEVSANMQDTWKPAALLITESFTVARSDYGPVASVTMEFREIVVGDNKCACTVKITRTSARAYPVNRLAIEIEAPDHYDPADAKLQTFVLKNHLDTQEFNYITDKKIPKALLRHKELSYLLDSNEGAFNANGGGDSVSLKILPGNNNSPAQLKTKLTISASNAPHATWTLPSEDSKRLDTASLEKIKTLSAQKNKQFSSLKKALLNELYITLPEYHAALGISESSNDQSRLSFSQAIAMAIRSEHSNAADAVTTLINKQAAAIVQAGIDFPEALLEPALRLRHYHPESCLRILLYLDPTHTLVFEDQVLKGDLSQLLCNYPINRDITEYTLKLEVFHIDKDLADEPLASFQQVYTLDSLHDDAVPSVFIRGNNQQALYLDLTEANAKAQAEDRLDIQSLRLNTLFGKQLVALATQSVDQALSWTAQHLKEPPLEPGSSATTVDFHSANGLYFWELFFHVPFLLSWLQRQNRDYAQAWRWCTRYLFDPYRTWVPQGNHPPLFWLTRPLLGRAAFAASAQVSDPDLLAYADPERYRKALHLFVVENWQRQGDDQYRLLNLDSLVEAALCYDKALRLIGLLPEDLSSAPHQALTLADARTDDFTPPLNNKLVELRNLLRNRQFNLRHGLTLDGTPAAIALDPAVLDQLAHGAVGVAQDRRSDASVARVVPPCRYEDVRKSAGEAVLQLIELGQTLLRLHESEAAQKLALASKTHIISLLKFPCRLQEQALELAKRERDTVLMSQQMAQSKQAYYQGLVDEGITDLETAAMALGGIAQSLHAASIPFNSVASGLAQIPTIFGLAFGGANPSQGLARVGTTFEALGKVSELVEADLRLRAEYQLRAQQWQHEADQACYELKIIDQQLRERDIHIRAACIALEEARAKLQCHEVEYELMTSVFASHPTYLWLIGRLAEIYSSAYGATLSLCLMAEACLQYELGDFSSTWIKTDSWLDNWRGMLAGEALERDLMLMDLAAMRDNHRPLDIHANLSLVKDLGWSKQQLHTQLATDVIHFELAPQHFDTQFPGHYLRRIERIWLTFNTDKRNKDRSLSAMLYQTANRVLLTDDLEGAKHLYAGDQGNANAVLRDLRPNQSVAIWSIRETNRNFDLQPSIPDKSRYQPFEGTGLLSSWTIAFPSAAMNNASLFDGKTCTLEDITVHLIYSAVEGSQALRDGVKALLEESKTAKDKADTANADTANAEQARKAAEEMAHLQRLKDARAKALKAEQQASASSETALNDASVEVLKHPDAAAELKKASAAAADAQQAANEAKAAREEADAAATPATADAEAEKAAQAAGRASEAAAKALQARKAAEEIANLKRFKNALAKVRKAEQQAYESSETAHNDASAEVLKHPDVAAELKKASAAAADAQKAADEAKVAMDKADAADRAEDADAAEAEAEKAAQAASRASAAAAKAAQARKAAEDAYNLREQQAAAAVIARKIEYLKSNMGMKITVERKSGGGNPYYNRGTLVSIDEKNNTFILKDEAYGTSQTLPVMDAPPY